LSYNEKVPKLWKTAYNKAHCVKGNPFWINKMKKQNKKILIYDTTLRDGSQGAGISFSVDDKLKIAKALDAFGVAYIEGGWPGSNPKDEEFFKLAKKIKFKNAKLSAFGSTRRKGIKAQDDANLNKIISSGARAACIFGKSWDLHVKTALKTSLTENLKMISDSIAFLKSKGLEVMFDAEHFFDGYVANPKYALETLQAAYKAGVDVLCLCDTNGGMLPSDILKIFNKVKVQIPGAKFGVHLHNDAGCAVASSVSACEAGAVMVHGTINGIGERCGNANLCTIIANLELKKGFSVLPKNNIKKLTEISRYVDEIANIVSDDSKPYVGRNAFAHKAGVHVSAVEKNSKTYEHVKPESVGNERRVLVSDLSGKSNLMSKASELALKFNAAKDDVCRVVEAVKNMENLGYQYEDADGSFKILTEKVLKSYKPFFKLKSYNVSVYTAAGGKIISEATVKLDVSGKEEHTVAEGDGPVNALDNCLRKALIKFYPEISKVRLTDFKVRVIDSGSNTAAKVRVLIESSDHAKSWGTIGVSENIIDASWQALSDSIEYKLLKSKPRQKTNKK
jgi:2-isopropylmalate synthase